MRGQRGSNCDGGRLENGGGRRGPAGGSGGMHGFPEGTEDGGGSGRGVSTYHTPSIPKSRGRYAADSSRWQSTLLGSSRESSKKGKGREKLKKYKERQRGFGRDREQRREKETEVKEQRKFVTRVRRSFSTERGGKK